MEGKTYSIGEVSRILNIPISTIRYYDKQGLLPLIKRSGGNMRIFDEDDLSWLKLLECLKGTGMQLNDIKTYFRLCREGRSTYKERYEMLLRQKKETESKMDELKQSLNIIDYKCTFYKIMCESDTAEPSEEILKAMEPLETDF